MKFLSTIVALILATTAAHAQDFNEDDTYMFNHMSMGLSGGTDGVGLDFALPLGKYVQVRAGISYIPAVGITSALDCVNTECPLDENGKVIDTKHWEQTFFTKDLRAQTVDIKSTPKFLNGKLLFNFYPAPSFPLHLTLGAYFGSEKIIELENVGYEKELKLMYDHNGTDYHNISGVKVGKYTLIPDRNDLDNGKIYSWIQTSAIRPYAGLGYGKAYSEKGIDWMVEAGVIYWNKPKLFSRATDYNSKEDGVSKDVELQEDKLCGNKGSILKIMSKTPIYPVISFRLGFNMF